jgi:hypothetical protein
MKAVRAVLAFLWLLFGVTATAHAASPATAEQPCHTMAVAGSHAHLPPSAPRDNQSFMPCCSQPVVIAPLEFTVPIAIRMQAVRLKPAPAVPLAGHVPAFEPRPPKTA